MVISLTDCYRETDYGEPIVSVSLGLPAIFLFGGLQRKLDSRADAKRVEQMKADPELAKKFKATSVSALRSEPNRHWSAMAGAQMALSKETASAWEAKMFIAGPLPGT